MFNDKEKVHTAAREKQLIYTRGPPKINSWFPWRPGGSTMIFSKYCNRTVHHEFYSQQNYPFKNEGEFWCGVSQVTTLKRFPIKANGTSEVISRLAFFNK